MAVLGDLPGWGVFGVFLAAAALVWVAGTRLAVLGDEIAERLNLTREFMGLIFLAAVTELPEIVTTVTAARVDNAELVLGNLFGGITLNTAILAAADFFSVRYALTSWPRKPTHALVAVMLIVLLSMLLAVTMTGDLVIAGGVGLGAILLALGFPVVIGLQRQFDNRTSWAPVDLPEDLERAVVIRAREHFEGRSTGELIARALFFSALIFGAGMALAMSADVLAVKSGLGASFIGVTLLAAATSMPELSTTLAAARIGAHTMAIANVFGSNLIMVALILPADMAYSRGAILSDAGPAMQFALATGIMVTAIYVAGILIRRTPVILGAGLDSWLVAGVWLGSIAGLFFLG